ncbi:lipocalin family protein [Nibribacter koreensis]|uniref:Lipocalin-like domain-containing protein n=1 Tax=Nibribacter koreensis TaxID=1084519 RepID=A0ABP8FYH2_9BACT
MRNIIYALLALLIFPSCDKDEPATLIGTWMRTEVYAIDNAGNRSHNNLDYAPTCEKDNLYQFTGNNEYYLKEGGNICQPSAESSDKYELLENGTKIKFQKGGLWMIESLSGASLTVKQALPPGVGFKEIVTIFKRR